LRKDLQPHTIEKDPLDLVDLIKEIHREFFSSLDLKSPRREGVSE
jgi:hypothetical protein